MTKIESTDKPGHLNINEEINMDYETGPDPQVFENAMKCLVTLHKVARKKPNNLVKESHVTKKAYEWFIKKSAPHKNRGGNGSSNVVHKSLKYLEDRGLITRIEYVSETMIATTEKGCRNC